jgi:spore coat protein H
VLKAYAIDVATGNWDDYFYNKNNYYLYDNPATGRFEFLTFDTDNTFGVDWVGKDWARRNCLAWHFQGDPRPLATKLLAVPAFKNQFVHYLDTLARLVVHPDSIFPRIDALHALITPAALADTFRTLDWGYTVANFHDGFDQTIDGHTPYGIKPFLAIRVDSILSQIAGWDATGTAHPGAVDLSAEVFPNPAAELIFVKTGAALFAQTIDARLFDLKGKTVANWRWEAYDAPHALSLEPLPNGVYFLKLTTPGQYKAFPIEKRSP